MNGVELFLLGRALMKIGEEALPTEGIRQHPASTRPVLIVVNDLRVNPGSAVGEIATRTGLPQSAVSTAIARLREAGAVTTETDPRDHRRLLVQPAPELSSRVEEIRATPINAALAAALNTDNQRLVADLVALLEELALHLTPHADQPQSG